MSCEEYRLAFIDRRKREARTCNLSVSEQGFAHQKDGQFTLRAKDRLAYPSCPRLVEDSTDDVGACSPQSDFGVGNFLHPRLTGTDHEQGRIGVNR